MLHIRFLALLAVFLLCLGTHAPGSLAAPAPNAYLQARTLLDEQPYSSAAYEQAEELEQQLLKRDPKHAQAYALLARIEEHYGYQSGDDYEPESLTKAHALVDMGLRLNPRLADLYVEKGFIYAYQRNFDEARRMLKRARELDPKHAGGGLLAAKIASLNGDEAEAFQHAMGVIRSTTYAPYQRRAYHYVADYSETIGDLVTARRAYQNSMTLFPKDPWIKNNYSRFLRDAKQYDEAISIGEASKQLMDFGMIRHNLATAYQLRGYERLSKQKLYAKACEDFKRSLENKPDPEVYYLLGWSLQQLAGQTQNYALLDQSEQALRQALALNPKHQNAKTALDYQLKFKR
ncbi:Lipopolysaccharide assembly protein B [compost metagenome]